MTLDESKDAFEGTPSNETAAAYMANLLQYEADDMIGDDTFRNGLASVLAYLKGEMK